MATRVVVQRICDVCGEYAEGVEVVPVTITLEKQTYELDVCEDHKDDLLATWIHVARKAQKTPNAGKAIGGHRKAAERSKEAKGGVTASGRPRTLPCAAKGCDRLFADERSRSKHHSTIHGIRRK